MSGIEKHRIVHSPLSNRVFIARFGKDPTLALDKKDATAEFLMAITGFMFDGKMPELGATNAITYGAGDENFKLTLERVTKEGEAN